MKYIEFQERFKTMDDNELVKTFNREILNNGWTNTRAVYLTCLREEFNKRGYDYSGIRGKGEPAFGKKIKLEGNKVVVIK